MKRAQPTVDPDAEPQQAGVALGLCVIAALAALLLAYLAVGGVATGPWRASPGNALLGANAMAWGLVFLLSYYFSAKSFVFRGFLWFCLHVSAPAGRKLALVWFAFLALAGAAMFLTGMGWL